MSGTNAAAVAAVARALSGDNFPSLHHVRQAESAIKAYLAYDAWQQRRVANDNLPNAAAQFKRRAANDAPTDAELIMQAWGVEAVA